MRYECVRDDIPTKWSELELLPGMGEEWILIQSNGIVDPAKTEMIMNEPTPEYRGTFEETGDETDRRIEYLEALGYIKVQEKQDDDDKL